MFVDYSVFYSVFTPKATSVDRSDVTVWNQLASMGSLLGNLLLARKSLEQALCCHPSYWPAIENLCTVLYALGDFSGVSVCVCSCDKL